MSKKDCKWISVVLMLLLLFVNSVIAQSFEETVDYINENLKNHTFQPALPSDEWPTYVYDQIAVSKDGKITVNRWIEDKKTKELTEGYYAYGYLKNINYKQILDKGFNSKDGYVYNYFLELETKDQSYSILSSVKESGSTGQRDKFTFYLNNKMVAERVANAFKHLIALAEKNPKFLERDLFEQ